MSRTHEIMSLIFKFRNMAVQDAKGLYRGAIGNLIFKVVDGKQIVQARALSVKQSEKTKKGSTIFGLCSSQATGIRGKLKSWMNGCYDGKISSRFYFRLSTF